MPRVEGPIHALAGALDRVLALGLPAGIVMAAAGIAALTVATRHRRAFGVAGGAALGALAALAAGPLLRTHAGLPETWAVGLGAAAGGAIFGAFPAALPFAIGAAPGALVGASLPLAGSRIAGAAAGALGAGMVGLLASREVAAFFASFAGGLLLGAGLVAAFGKTPLAREIAGRPLALVAFAVVAGIAGTVLQIARREARGEGARTADESR